MQGAFGGQKGALTLRRVEVFLKGVGLVFLDHALVIAANGVRLRCREQGAIVMPQRLRRRVLGDARAGPVEQQVAAVQVFGKDGIAGAVHHGGQQLLGAFVFSLGRQFAARQGQRLGQLTLHQAKQQQGGHDDKQPAFECAGQQNVVGIAEKPGHQLVRHHNPQPGEQGIGQGQLQGGWRGRQRGIGFNLGR